MRLLQPPVAQQPSLAAFSPTYYTSGNSYYKLQI